MYHIANRITLGIKIISMVLGILLNLMVILVRAVKFYRHHKISAYHFIIIQVALADLIFASLIVFEVDSWVWSEDTAWRHSLTLCRIVRPLQLVAATVPGYLILLLAFERYQKVTNRVRYMLLMRRVVVITLLLWVFTYISHLPHTLALGFWQHPYNSEMRWCVANWQSMEMKKAMQLYLLVAFLVIPLVCTALFHLQIYYFVRKHTRKMTVYTINTDLTIEETMFTCGASKDSVNTKLSSTSEKDITTIVDNNCSESASTFDDRIIGNDGGEEDDTVFAPPARKESQVIRFTIRKISRGGNNICKYFREKALSFKKSTARPSKERILRIHILLAITACFFLCMFPHHLWYVLHYYGHFGNAYTTYKAAGHVLGCFFYLHCFINGIIYSVSDKQFRTDVFLITKSMIYMIPYRRQESKSTM